MDFASDNVVGASEPILAAMLAAGRSGPEGTYGADRWSIEACERIDALFGRPCSSLLVATGTAANALALALLAPPFGGVFCHVGAHVIDDECGAPEFYTGGAKLFGVPGPAGKMTPAELTAALARIPAGIRQVRPAALTLSQATEAGTVYSVAEIAALADIAHAAGLGVHMDGARFANALVELGCSAAEMTWKAGVDVLSFGATKNGALACEAMVFFDKSRAADAPILRKRGGHTVSKGRLLGAQMAAYLRDDHWLALAGTANAMASRLAGGLAAAGIRLPWRRQANEVFAVLPGTTHAALQAAGVHYYPWEPALLEPGQQPAAGEVFVRLICSFATTAAEVDRLLALIAQAV